MSVKPSRNMLRKLAADHPAEPAMTSAPPGARTESPVRLEPVAAPMPPIAQAFNAPPVVQEAHLRDIEFVWGKGILTDEAKFLAIIRARAEITEEAGKVLRSSLNIGRALIDVRQHLTGAEFSRSLAHSRTAWCNLSRGTVTKLMRVAEWWDSGTVPKDRAPQSYTILYEFASMAEEHLKEAVQRGVFRPDVTRIEVMGFKRRVGGSASSQVIGSDDQNLLLKLQERRRQLLGELLSIRRQMVELRAESDISAEIASD